MRRTIPLIASVGPARSLLSIILLVVAFAGCAGTPDRDAVTIPASRIEQLTKALSTRVDRPPIPKGAVAHPYYPDYAMRHPKPGMVLLKIDVDAKGRVSAVEVVESTNVFLESAARQAALQWSFEPAMRRGVAVPATIVVPVEFTQGTR